MGYWSKRQKEGGRWGGVRKGRRLGPRRRISAVLRTGETIFSPASVRYDCGHEGLTWAGRSCPSVGAYGHCKSCLSGAARG